MQCSECFALFPQPFKKTQNVFAAYKVIAKHGCLHGPFIISGRFGESMNPGAANPGAAWLGDSG